MPSRRFPATQALLVVEDALALDVVTRALTHLGVEVMAHVSSVHHAAARLSQLELDSLIVIAEDIIRDGTVLDVMAASRPQALKASVIVVATPQAVEVAVEAIRRGAAAFLTKPVDLDVVMTTMERMLTRLHACDLDTAENLLFLGPSSSAAALKLEATRVAQSGAAVLISGATGAGKGVLARWLHVQGRRSNGPFVDVNCASLSRELFESEMYGFERGAFTGADGAKTGLIEAANQGTLFLDEIGDLALSVQPRLLKVIEERRFRRLGSIRERTTDARFIAASNQDLEQLARDRQFRQDLLFRLNTLTLMCPPLRRRPEDIPDIARRLVEQTARDLSTVPLSLSNDAIEALCAYPWPGNIRELHHVIQRASLASTDGVLTASDLRFGPSVPDDVMAPAEEATLESVQVRYIRSTLEAEGWNVERAAQRLGIPRSTLYNKIKTYGLGNRQL